MTAKTFAEILRKNEEKNQDRSKVNTTVTISQDTIAKAEFIVKHSTANSAASVISDVVEGVMLDFISTFRESVPLDKRDAFDKELQDELPVSDFFSMFHLNSDDVIRYANIVMLDLPDDECQHTSNTVKSGKIIKKEDDSITFEYLDKEGKPQEKIILKEYIDWEEDNYEEPLTGECHFIRFISAKPIKEDASPILSIQDDSYVCIDGYYLETWNSEYSDIGSDITDINAPFSLDKISGFKRNDNTLTVTPTNFKLNHVKDNIYEMDGHTFEFLDSCKLSVSGEY